MRARIAYILIVITTLTVVFFAMKNQIKADIKGEFVNQKEVQLEIEGKKKTYIIKTYDEGQKYQSYLIEKDLFYQKIKKKLTGFEQEVDTCPFEGNLICLYGDVGAHSQNIQIFKYKNNIFKTIQFEDKGQKYNNITSDEPNFQLLDYNNDQLTDLYIDNRNYDANPLSDIIRRYYKQKDDILIFDREDNINYDE